MSIRRLCYSAVFLAACAAGCKPKAGPVPAVSPAPAVTEGTPATEAECKAFAAQVEAATAARDRVKLNALLSIEDLAVRCVSDIPLAVGQRQSLVQGLRRGAQNNTFVTQVLAEVEKGGTYTVLRVHTVGGRARALLRLISPDNGVNYHDFLLTRTPDGRVGLEDVYILTGGEMLSQTLRRLLLPAAAEMNRGILADLKGQDKTFLNNLPKVQSMAQAVQAGKGGEAVAIYRSLPADLRTHKVVALHHVQAASLVGDADYAAALQEYRRLFPTDPALDFLSIDYFLLKKQYDEAIRCIRSVATAVGGDPYLVSMEGTTLADAGRFQEAKAASEKAVAEEPSLADTYWGRVSIALKEKNHPDTLTWLRKVVEKCGVEIDDLTTADDYAGFVKSPQHGEWLKWYAGRKK